VLEQELPRLIALAHARKHGDGRDPNGDRGEAHRPRQPRDQILHIRQSSGIYKTVMWHIQDSHMAHIRQSRPESGLDCLISPKHGDGRDADGDGREAHRPRKPRDQVLLESVDCLIYAI